MPFWIYYAYIKFMGEISSHDRELNQTPIIPVIRLGGAAGRAKACKAEDRVSNLGPPENFSQEKLTLHLHAKAWEDIFFY